MDVYRVNAELCGRPAEACDLDFVCLDLVSTLLAQDKNTEAVQLANGMARLLMKLQNNLLARAAVVELISAALDGKLSERIVGQVRAKLRQGFTPQRGATRP